MVTPPSSLLPVLSFPNPLLPPSSSVELLDSIKFDDVAPINDIKFVIVLATRNRVRGFGIETFDNLEVRVQKGGLIARSDGEPLVVAGKRGEAASMPPIRINRLILRHFTLRPLLPSTYLGHKDINAWSSFVSVRERGVDRTILSGGAGQD
ncbi:hypothetical protein U1Q18_024855 [Sarracenia purpurea var. burkii]